MRRHRFQLVFGDFRAIPGLLALALAVTGLSSAAEARVHRHHHHHARGESTYSPPYAAIVVDGNNGKVLHASNADSPRHPASLTKIMTLYLLFEQLDAGKLKLDSRLRTSAHAAEQDPTKLGLEAGQSIQVEDAIKAIVTKSANDVAVAIAEAIGGDERSFAELMTHKAHALGMTRTIYVNASGLPNDEQITTARDQALLGRAIQDRFPRYYHYFATAAFRYHGMIIRNHNHLLGQVEGVDGIKTGYTNASGFNLVTSMHRRNRHLVAVVMGGSSAGSRDAKMRELLEAHLSEAATERTVPTLVETGEPAHGRTRVASASIDASVKPLRPGESAQARPTPHVIMGSAKPIEPIPVKTIAVRAGALQTAALSPLVAPTPQAAIAPAWAASKPAAQPVGLASRSPAMTQTPVHQPSEARALAAEEAQIDADPVPPPQHAPAVTASRAPPGASGVLGTLTFHPDPVQSEPTVSTLSSAEKAPKAPAAHSGWVIQLGAFTDEAEAKERLRSAQSMAQDLLASADAFTERVVRGSKEFYRARFAGLDKDQAEAACHYFKRNEIACMALKN